MPLHKKKYFDIAPPGKAFASATSRPIARSDQPGHVDEMIRTKQPIRIPLDAPGAPSPEPELVEASAQVPEVPPADPKESVPDPEKLLMAVTATATVKKISRSKIIIRIVLLAAVIAMVIFNVMLAKEYISLR